MANRTPEVLTAAARHKGRRKGHASSGKRANRWLLDFQFEIRAIARELGETNEEIAAQLNARGFAAPRGGPVNKNHIQKAFSDFGVERGKIKKLRMQASEAADEFNIDPQLMIFQLWHEWQHHEAVKVFLHHLPIADKTTRPFVFNPVHPDEWVIPSNRPNFDPNDRIKLGLLGPPPWSFLAQALFGTIEVNDDVAKEIVERKKGEVMRREMAVEQGVEYSGHEDDLANIRAYLSKMSDRSALPPDMKAMGWKILPPDEAE